MKLSKTSEVMLSYFIENNCIKHDKQTNKTDTILLKLYDDIMEANIFLQKKNQIKREKTSVLKITSKSQILRPSIFNYQSFPKNVMDHIEHHSKFMLTYNFFSL
jgi:hypothetical protein